MGGYLKEEFWMSPTTKIHVVGLKILKHDEKKVAMYEERPDMD